jgi:hypothetical protein
MPELAITTELYNCQKQYNTPIAILTEDGTEGGSLKFSQKKVIRMIEFYSNSRYLLSQKDNLGFDKPFYNIGNAICDVEDAAKDFDSKDVAVTADDEHYVESFLLTKDIYQWMKRVRLGMVINQSKRLHTRYGSVLAKKCEKEINGEKTIYIDFPEWKNVTNDQKDILNGVIIEKHYLTRAELFDKKDVWNEDKIKEAIKATPKDGKVYGRLNVYEIRGMFPRSFFKEVDSKGAVDYENDTDFSYQYYVLCETTAKNCIPLYWEDDTEKVYKFLARKPKAGRDFGVGVIEENEEAQVWINDAVQKQQKAFNYSAKVSLQSASKKLRSRNVLTEWDDGQILEHEDNKPITPVQLVPAGGMAEFHNMIEQWYTLANRNSSAYESQRGEKPSAGTAFRLQAMTLQQSSSVFKDLQEELAMFWEDIFNDWIMPYLSKKLTAEHILAHNYSPDELKEIDKSFGIWTANQNYINKVLGGGIHTQEEYDADMQAAAQGLQSTKDQRFLKIPKGYYKDMESRITISISGESKDKQQALDSLANIMKEYAANPALAQDAVMTKLFMEIVELSNTGISPVSLMAAINEQAKKVADQAKQAPQNKVSESISFKDLPADGQVQMAQQAGIKISPPQAQPTQTQPQPAMAGGGQ